MYRNKDLVNMLKMSEWNEEMLKRIREEIEVTTQALTYGLHGADSPKVRPSDEAREIKKLDLYEKLDHLNHQLTVHSNAKKWTNSLLNLIPEPDRQFLIDLDVKGTPYSEIAEKYGMHKNHISRKRTRILNQVDIEELHENMLL